MTFDKDKKEQLKILLDAKNKIYDAFKDDKRFSLYSLKAGYGINKKNCDMTLYRWIPVMIDNKICWVTLFYNYIDPNTKNTHTDFGRIGFCRPLRQSVKKPFGNTGVDKNSWASPTGFGSFTPKNKKWLTVDDVCDKDFDMKALADSLAAYAAMEKILVEIFYSQDLYCRLKINFANKIVEVIEEPNRELRFVNSTFVYSDGFKFDFKTVSTFLKNRNIDENTPTGVYWNVDSDIRIVVIRPERFGK